jgi:hypothetical protein
MDDDLTPSKTEGFKVGEKKTIDEYKNLGRTNSIPISLRRQSFQELGLERPHALVT